MERYFSIVKKFSIFNTWHNPFRKSGEDKENRTTNLKA